MLRSVAAAAAVLAACLPLADTHVCNLQASPARALRETSAFVGSGGPAPFPGRSQARRCGVAARGAGPMGLARGMGIAGLGRAPALRQRRAEGTAAGLRMAGVSWSNSGSDHEESADEVFTNSDSVGDEGAWQQLPKIFVLLFNPRTDNEGIYTLQIKRRDGQLVNTIVMFEDTEDAERYSGLLEAQDFPSPSVEVIEPAEIKDFALGAGYQTTFIPKGTLFMPPENSVSDRPWSPEGDAAVEFDLDPRMFSREEPEPEIEDLEGVRAALERLYGGNKPQ